MQAHAHKSIHWKSQHICIQQFKAGLEFTEYDQKKTGGISRLKFKILSKFSKKEIKKRKEISSLFSKKNFDLLKYISVLF